MELIGSIFLILAVAVVVALFIGRPFLLGAASKTSTGISSEQERDQHRSTLLAERDRALNALQELDFDYALGKVPAEEYPQQRAALLKKGADVLRQLDAFEAIDGSAALTGSGSVEDRIEATVAARRADASRAAGAQSQAAAAVVGSGAASSGAAANGGRNGKDELEELIASRKRQRSESSAGFCPRCGKPVQKSDKFCSKCGATL